MHRIGASKGKALGSIHGSIHPVLCQLNLHEVLPVSLDFGKLGLKSSRVISCALHFRASVATTSTSPSPEHTRTSSLANS
jgi:hypothetical protein